MNTEEFIRISTKRKFNQKTDSIKYIGAGSFGKIYKAEAKSNSYIFKIYSKAGMADKEAEALRLLAENDAVKIPKVYFIHTADNGFENDVICMEFIKGKNALFNAKLLFADRKRKQKFADDVIRGINAIHKIKNAKFGFIGNPVYDSWTDFYKEFADDIYNRAVTENKKGNFHKYILNTMTQAINSFDKIFSENVSEAVLIHGDLNVMNIMVDESFKITAFIDPLNSMYADREYELFQLTNLTGNVFGLYNTYKASHKTSPNCEAKCAFYSLFNEAMVYLNTGRYTSFIMLNAILKMKKELSRLR